MADKIFIEERNGHKLIRCPGCGYSHALDDRWAFNNDLEKPTFSPSLLVKSGKDFKEICHSFIREGVWEFLNDCTHDKAGQKVPVPEW